MTDNISDTLYSNDAYFYDLDNREPLKVDIPFYLGCASRISANSRILELACGTGRITIPLAKAGHEVWALEYSEAMIDVFEDKLKNLPEETASKIHLIHGDMSNFEMGQKFPLILLPARSFQLLLDEDKEISCLKNVHAHLSEDGTFIIAIGNFIGSKEQENAWVSKEEVFDWENTDPKTGYKVRRFHINKKIDTNKQIIYPQKIYHISGDDGTEEKIIKQSSWKYFNEKQIKNLLVSNGFTIIDEMGSFDDKPINKVSDFIFVCRKAP
jgi:SAM-dependent methyltransferase